MDTITQTPLAAAALGAWPMPPVPVVPVTTPVAPTVRRCENRALVYVDDPTEWGGQRLDRIVACTEPAVTDRWSRRGTDQAQRQQFCQQHAASLDAFLQVCRQRIDAAYAARGEEPLDYHLGDRVTTPDGPGTVTFLPSAAWSDTYAVGLDTRRRGDRPGQYLPWQLAPLPAA